MVIPCLKRNKSMCKTIKVDNEIAYECKKYPNYFITKTGKLYSIFLKGQRGVTDINNPHELAYGQDKDGYYRVVLCCNGRKKYIKIHTLVVEQFIGDVIAPLVINHRDGNKHNNNVDNLEITTVKLNTQHAHKHGLTTTGHKVQVENNNCIYYFNSFAECCRVFPVITDHYLHQLKNNIISYRNIYFVKKSNIYYAYYNGKILKTFNTLIAADKYFKKSRGTTWSAYKNCERRKNINQYHITFLNVSTIESIS